MKNLFKITLMFIVASILFVSCKTMSVTKRHYNKGYYVSHSSKKSTKDGIALKKDHKVEALAPKTSAVSSSKKEEPELLASSFTHNEIITPEVKTRRATENRIRYAETSKAQTIKDVVKSPFKITKMVPSADRSGDALSLIWLLIVVILIVYILGLLFDGFGLGGLIHILAVIALVLLVLWLLRII